MIEGGFDVALDDVSCEPSFDGVSCEASFDAVSSVELIVGSACVVFCFMIVMFQYVSLAPAERMSLAPWSAHAQGQPSTRARRKSIPDRIHKPASRNNYFQSDTYERSEFSFDSSLGKLGQSTAEIWSDRGVGRGSESALILLTSCWLLHIAD